MLGNRWQRGENVIETCKEVKWSRSLAKMIEVLMRADFIVNIF